MRLISVALTADQILDQSKDVTRRLGWLKLKVGDLIQPVRKCMGLKPGEKVERIGPPLRVVSVRREALHWITPDECRREGFPDMTGDEFVAMFCATHKGCTPATEITRIEFTYEVFQ